MFSDSITDAVRRCLYLKPVDVHVVVLSRPGLCSAVGTQPQLVVVVDLADERPAVGTPVLSGARFADLTEAADAHTPRNALEVLETGPGTGDRQSVSSLVAPLCHIVPIYGKPFAMWPTTRGYEP